MYTYVILLMCCIVSSAFFVVKQNSLNGAVQYLCVTNSSLPISWIDRDNTETYQQVSEFIPKKNYNNLSWNLSYISEKYWSIENSLDGNISQIILDRRWENMTVEKTYELTNYGEKLKFLPVLTGLKRNFVIPFSLKAEHAHMFLCDGAEVWQSNCYWFLLQVPKPFKSLKETAIRKCMSGSLSQFKKGKVKIPCIENSREILHTLKVPEYLNRNRWRHFILEKNGNVLSFSQVKESGQKELLRFNESNILNVTHMLIHTKYYSSDKVSNGLWKIHQLNYMYTNKITDKTRLGPIITTFNNFICISMFVTMCSSCELILTISKNEDPKQILFQRNYTQKSKWSEIKLFHDNIKSNEVILLVSTINKDHTRGFWAVDSIRQCQKDEFRVISSPQRTECQLVSYNEDILLYQEQSEVKTYCPEDTISQCCVPCSWFSNNCDQLSVYEKVCPEGKYGASCSYTCGNKCRGTCNKLDGTCNPKRTVFVTSSPSIPILDANFKIFPSNHTPTAKNYTVLDELEAPHDLHTEWTSENNLKLNWKYSNVTIQNIQYFNIKAMSSNHCKTFSDQLYVRNINEFIFFYEIKATNLCPSTQYCIKIGAYYNGSNGPETTTNVTSPPKIPILDDLNDPRKFPSDHTATANNFISNAKIEAYYNGFSGPEITTKVTSPSSISILDDNLRALSSNHTATAKNFLEELEAPHDLNTEWTSENNLKLNWKYSNVTIQNIQYFSIKAMSSNHCKAFSDKLFVRNITEFMFFYEIKATNLCPSTQYCIKIGAFCNGSNGPEITTNVTTPPKIPIFDDIPRIFTSNHTATLKIFVSKLLRDSSLSTYKLFLLITDDESPTTSISQELRNLTQKNLHKYRMIFECKLTDALNISELNIGDNSAVGGCLNHPNPPLNFRTSYNISIILTNTYENRSSYKEYVLIFQTGEIIDKSSVDLTLIIGICLVTGIFILILLLGWRRVKSPVNDYQINENEIQLMCFSEEMLNNEIIEPKPIEKNYFQKNGKEIIKINDLRSQYTSIINIIANKALYQEISDDLNYDYIDMQFKNSTIKKAYLITGVPKFPDIEKFWSIIWNGNIKNIIMLDNIYNKQESEIYWNDDKNENLRFLEISVQLCFCEFFANYEYRTFVIVKGNETRHVDQLRYVSWFNNEEFIDYVDLVPFFRKMSNIVLSTDSPIMIHARNGAKRTGFALLCDMCLRLAKAEGVFDILTTCQKLVDSSIIIDNFEQYIMTHLVIYEILFGANTSIKCNSGYVRFKNKYNENEIQNQILYLKKTLWLDQIVQTIKIKRETELYFGINVCSDQVVLNGPESKKTISQLMIIDGYRQPHKFIVIQQPTSESLSKFWKMITEKNIFVVIFLNSRIDQNNDFLPKCKFWPCKKNTTMKPSKHIIVKYKNEKSFESYDWLTVELLSNKINVNFQVEIILLKDWLPLQNCPPSILNFITFCSESKQICKRSNQVLLTCYDGIKACGLYLVMMYNIEKMKQEETSDICTAVRVFRQHCLEFINDEQYSFLCKSAVVFMNESSLYENLNQA